MQVISIAYCIKCSVIAKVFPYIERRDPESDALKMGDSATGFSKSEFVPIP